MTCARTYRSGWQPAASQPSASSSVPSRNDRPSVDRPGLRRVHSLSGEHGSLAQLAEQLTLNQRVVGSSPTRPTIRNPVSDGVLLVSWRCISKGHLLGGYAFFRGHAIARVDPQARRRPHAEGPISVPGRVPCGGRPARLGEREATRSPRQGPGDELRVVAEVNQAASGRRRQCSTPQHERA